MHERFTKNTSDVKDVKVNLFSAILFLFFFFFLVCVKYISAGTEKLGMFCFSKCNKATFTLGQ